MSSITMSGCFGFGTDELRLTYRSVIIQSGLDRPGGNLKRGEDVALDLDLQKRDQKTKIHWVKSFRKGEGASGHAMI